MPGRFSFVIAADLLHTPTSPYINDPVGYARDELGEHLDLSEDHLLTRAWSRLCGRCSFAYAVVTEHSFHAR
jgi:hypothetical protein